MEAGGPQLRPVSVGQAIARGGMTGLNMYNELSAQQRRLKILEAEERRREEEGKALAELRRAQAERAMRIAGTTADTDLPAEVRVWEYFNKLPKEKQDEYLGLKRQMWQVGDIGGVPSLVGRAPGMQTQPLSTLQGEMTGQAAIAGARQTAQERAKAAYDLIAGSVGGRPAFSTRLEEVSGRGAGDSEQYNQALSTLPPQLQAAMGGVRIPSAGSDFQPAAAAEPTIARERAAATAQGTKEGSYETRAMDYSRLMPVIEKIESGHLLTKATGSLAGRGRDIALGAVGLSGHGAKAIAELEPLVGEILRTVPRFEGPQSDADRNEYQRQAGDLASPTKPESEKKAALNSIKFLIGKYKYRHGERRQIDPAKGGGVAQWDTTIGRWVKVE